MMRKNIRILGHIDEELLTYVQKPGRYIGGEVNQIRRDLSACELTVGLCFPDTYEVAMSNTGLGIIYEVLNRMDGVAAERVFAPWLDAEQVMRKNGIPLFSLESKAAVADFDVLGFSLTTELCCTNVLNMLDLAGLEVRSAGRLEGDPIIIGGGGMANCCEPLADFVDIFVLGEGEEAAVRLIELLREMRKAGKSKTEMLLEVAQKFEWAYVPAFYEFEYDDGGIKNFRAKVNGLRTRFENAVVEDFENAPVHERPIVPFVEAIHERVSVEIMRGCPGRCRFCQASFCRRPMRCRSAERVFEIAKRQWETTGFDTVSLLSLSTADYPKLEELVKKLNEFFTDRHVGVSLPSLRVGQQLRLMPYFSQAVRKSGMTIAVEAGSERMRKIINKPVTDEDLFAGVEAAYAAGWQSVKLYFMAGLPGETDEDIVRIAQLCAELGRLRKKVAGRNGSITAAVSWLVPKPHTPFGWFGQRGRGYFERVRRLLIDEKMRLGAKFVEFKFHQIEQSMLESAVGRGDRRLGDVIEHAWRS
ncbi:MAG TPA: TIGR03960 family B12-binding radical SAM protein, partial [Sedimentisphaerales bacterium]|nr:TIGR03960 family B12-binding radical SAM protein [Sedimentisphaerales bacterium]